MINRVAFISVHTSPLDEPGSGDAGGMNVYIDSLSRALADLGTQVEVFTASAPGQPLAEKQVVSGYRVVEIPIGQTHDDADLVGQLTEGIVKWTAHNDVKYDVVHGHYWLSGWVGALLQDVLDRPLAISFHTLGRVKDAAREPWDPPESLVRIAAETEVISRAGCVVASTPVEAAELIEHYSANPERLCVSPPGVDHSVFLPGSKTEARKSLGVDPDRATVGFVGRIQPLKGIDVAIQAVGSLPDVDLLIVGGPSGPAGSTELDHLKSLAEVAAPGRVDFRPPLAHQRVRDVYRAVDVMVVPSRSESFGLVAAEAQACGTPVVAAAVGGLPFVVADERSGYLVDGHDPDAYAGAISRILSDPDTAAHLSEGAARNSLRFSWEGTAERMLQLYDGLA